MVNYPASLDDSTSLKHVVDEVDYVMAEDHNLLKDAIIELETKVGIDNSAVVTTHEYKINTHIASTSNPHSVDWDDVKTGHIASEHNTMSVVMLSDVTNAGSGIIISDAERTGLHAESHTLASHSTKAHSELSDAPVNAHHAQLHASSHSLGQGDVVDHDNLAGFVAGEHKLESAMSLANLGTRDHGSLSDAPTNAHHNEAHVLATTGPHTGTLPLTDLTAGVSGDIIIRGAVDWQVLPKGSDTNVLTLASGVPSWAAQGAPGAHADAHEVGGADLVDHDLLTNYAATRHYTQAEMSLANLGTKDHGSLSDAPVDAHHDEAHALDSAAHSDVSAVTDAKGAMLWQAVSGTWSRLTPAGTVGHVLKCTNADGSIEWGAPPEPEQIVYLDLTLLEQKNATCTLTQDGGYDIQTYWYMSSFADLRAKATYVCPTGYNRVKFRVCGVKDPTESTAKFYMRYTLNTGSSTRCSSLHSVATRLWKESNAVTVSPTDAIRVEVENIDYKLWILGIQIIWFNV